MKLFHHFLLTELGTDEHCGADWSPGLAVHEGKDDDKNKDIQYKHREGVHRVGGRVGGGRDASHQLLHGRSLRPQGESDWRM